MSATTSRSSRQLMYVLFFFKEIINTLSVLILVGVLMKRSTAIKLMVGSVFAPFVCNAFAQNKGVMKFIVAYGAGGATDLTARIFSTRLGKGINRNIIVENRPGGNSLIANRFLAKSAPDGNTYLFAPMSSTIFREIMQSEEKRGYSMLTDYKPVAILTTYPMAVMVPTELGVNNIKELEAWFKKNPSQAFLGCSALGSHSHLLIELLSQKLGIKISPVPYQSNNQIVTALTGNQIPGAIISSIEVANTQHNPKVKVIGTFTETRSDLTPQIPTFKEQGVEALGGDAWMGIWTTAKTPDEKIAPIVAGLGNLMGDEQFVEELRKNLGVSPMFKVGAEMLAEQEKEFEFWREVIATSGFKDEG